MPWEGLQDTRLVCKAAGPYPMGTLRGAWCVDSGPGYDARGVEHQIGCGLADGLHDDCTPVDGIVRSSRVNREGDVGW